MSHRPIKDNSDSGIQETIVREIQNSTLWNPESLKTDFFCNLESTKVEPSSTWDPESTSWNLDSKTEARHLN